MLSEPSNTAMETEERQDARAFRPTFLFGMERSGTTLLSMMVGAHPQIAVPLATTGMWIGFGRRLEDYGFLKRRDDLARFVDAILGHERVTLWDATLDRERILEDLPLGDYGAVICRVQGEYAHAKGKPYWANIDIATLDNMDLVNDWIGDARFVHIVRDGRDVALSHQTMPYGAGNIAECARAWVDRVGVNAKMGRILGADRYHTLRFEDIVASPEPTLAQLCEFLAVPFDPAMLRYGEMVAEKIPDDRRWLWPALSEPPQTERIGQWRQKMSVSKRIVFEGIANKTLKHWRYESYEIVPKSFQSYGLELWYFLTQGGRLQRWLKKWGIKRKSLLERNAENGQGRQ